MWIITNDRASLAEVRTGVTSDDLAILDMQGHATDARHSAEITSRTY